jgi:hypothetical protein
MWGGYGPGCLPILLPATRRWLVCRWLCEPAKEASARSLGVGRGKIPHKSTPFRAARHVFSLYLIGYKSPKTHTIRPVRV